MFTKSVYMNVQIPSQVIPAVFGCTVAVSGFIFNKLSHISEYIINKKFGDYEYINKTHDGRFIVSARRQDYYYFQNIALTVITAAISVAAARILRSVGNSPVMASAVSIAGIATPIFLCSFNMFLRQEGVHRGRWVELTESEFNGLLINKNWVTDALGERVYCSFGQAPIYIPGIDQDPDY